MLSLGSLSKLSELSSGLPLAADFCGFSGGVPPPLPPLAVLVRVVACCRPVFSMGPILTTTVRDVIFGSYTCLRLCFYSFALVESVHGSDFRGGSEYPGLELCFLVLQARLHCLCSRVVVFRCFLLPLSPDFDLDWCV